jgi:hypothetical protein
MTCLPEAYGKYSSSVTVVAELKYHAEKKTDTLRKKALAQIHERRYYNRYLGKVILLGIAFSGKDVGCRMEILNGFKDK